LDSRFFSLSLCKPSIDKLLDDELFVTFTNGFGGLVILQVIVSLTQTQTTLAHVYDVHGAVFVIGTHVETKEGIHAQRTQTGCQVNIGLLVGHLLNVFEYGFKRGCAFLIEPNAIHTQRVKVSDFLINRSSLVRCLADGFNQTVDLFNVLLGQFVERSIAGIFGTERIGLLPSAGCKLIKINTGYRCRIQVSHIQTGLISGGRLATSSQCEKSCCHEKGYFFHMSNV